DFNHHKPMNLERRVNVLIYLNDDWQPDYGGQLELWDAEMKTCVQSVVPLANRCAMFTLSEHSYHGNPQPVNHPEGTTRKSIALYYYTATWDEKQRPLTTQFKTRPGTEDKVDWEVKSRQMVKEYLPPFISRPTLRFMRKIRTPKT
ncbi:MAG: 2OG-Fe(II) oxygenase, partial [Pseudomonadota bacterium]